MPDFTVFETKFKATSMDERTIQAGLMRWVMEEKHHQLTIPNITMIYPWEADLISVTKTWLAHEYEIKISKADYNADMKKEKKHADLRHQFVHGGKPRQPRNELERTLFDRQLIDLRPQVPNYFWYATNGFDVEELPPYAGWIRIMQVGDLHRVQVEKEAPRLHTNKMSEQRRMDINRWLSFKLAAMYRIVYLAKGRLREDNG